LLGHIRQAK